MAGLGFDVQKSSLFFVSALPFRVGWAMSASFFRRSRVGNHQDLSLAGADGPRDMKIADEGQPPPDQSHEPPLASVLVCRYKIGVFEKDDEDGICTDGSRIRSVASDVEQNWRTKARWVLGQFYAYYYY